MAWRRLILRSQHRVGDRMAVDLRGGHTPTNGLECDILVNTVGAGDRYPAQLADRAELYRSRVSFARW
jgi:hypothetical protein